MANYKYPFKDKAGKDVVDADVYYSALGMASGGYYVFGPSGVHSGIHYESAMANLLSLDEGIGAMTKGEVVAYRINREYPTSAGAANVPTTAESTSAAFSTGFVLTRHTLEYPTGNKLTYFCLAMHLRSFGDYERMGSVVKRPAYWPAKICRVKETAKEKQTVPKGATDQPVIGLSVRAKPSFAKDSPVLGYLPHGARFTVLQRDKQWVKIKRVIEKAIVPPSTAQTEVPAAAHNGWVSTSWLEALGQAPEDFDVVVTPVSPPAVKAGELLGHMGEYRRVQDPQQSRKLMHHEIIVGPELRAFLEKSRAAAAKATPQQKTLLRVAPDVQLHNPVLAPPQAGLLPVNTIVALDGTPPDDALYVKVKPTGGMQWIDRKAKLPTGAKEANLFRLNDGAVYTAADIVRVPRQGTVGQPGATRFRGVFVGAASQTPVWITKDAYTALVSVQGGKLLTADLAQGWESFPLTFAANGPKNGAQPQHVSRLMLQQSRPDKQIPTELPKVFALDEAGNAWWQVQLKTGGTTAIGWVGEVGHAGVSRHSPHEWVDFKLIESKPTTAAYGSYFADFKQMEEFQRGRLGLKDVDLDVPLREVRALLDSNHDGQLTLAEVKAAQRDRDTIRQLSRVILRYPSEWKADKKAWDAYDELIPPSSRAAWEAEKARIAQLVWWDAVAGKVKDFPEDPFVFHIHPVAFFENCKCIPLPEIAWGKRVGEEFKAKVMEISEDLRVDPDYLMSCMAFETGETFRPDIRNAAGSGATGLVQFMPSTAVGLGTTTDKLSKMTAVEQLEYVHRYFLPSKGRLRELEDVYMHILYPAAVGKPGEYVIADKYVREDSGVIKIDKNGNKIINKIYVQNIGLDVDGNEKITKTEAASKVREKYEKGMGNDFKG
ncbi:SH3 domain-containing protein [Burkholderia cepacia]|uniref:SH3 domain-containing protein n=3 Tax=Burkholderia cepacia TaxID=292 RepID=UPI001CF39955|nr:SH3 domain-containing protein [Burkholderia cepacia]MCA8078206.1 SH3 domain-containing protein [Burkholderia cepacia]